MIQHQVLAALVQRPDVGGDDRAGIKDADGVGAESDLESTARVAGRDRVVGLAHTDPGFGIDATRQRRGDVEDRFRQRAQQRHLTGRGDADGLGAGTDTAGVVAGVRGGQRRVECRERSDVWDRGEMSSAEPPDLSLDTALLMRPLDAGDAEERVVAVVRAHRDEPGVLQALAAQRDPDHRRGEVVVADHPGRDTAECFEGAGVAVEERLLGLVGVGDVDGLARVRQA